LFDRYKISRESSPIFPRKASITMEFDVEKRREVKREENIGIMIERLQK